MPRFIAFVIFATLIAAPAWGQVINGETPLDETTISRRTPGPADQAQAPVAQPSDTTEPAQRQPQSAPRRD